MFSSIIRLGLGFLIGYLIGTVNYDADEFWGTKVHLPIQYSSHFQPTFRDETVINTWNPTTRRYAYGRYTKPFESVEYPVTDVAYPYFTLKRWAYYSVATDRHLFAFAVVQVNYAAVAFAYVVDLETKVKYDYSSMVPLGLGVDMAPSSVQGCTRYKGWSNEISACFDKDTKTWQISVDVQATNEDHGHTRHIKMAYEMELGDADSLVMHLPLDGNPLRPAYTHKLSGMHARGTLEIDDETYMFPDAAAALDWTKSLSLRRTEWNWASASFPADVQSVRNGTVTATKRCMIGINLSARVYDVEGHSMENGVWVDGTMYAAEGVHFDVPHSIEEQETRQWNIRSLPNGVDPTPQEHKVMIALNFTPWGARKENDDKIVAKTKFVQAYGVYSGEVRITDSAQAPEGETLVIAIANAYGVAEDHYALW